MGLKQKAIRSVAWNTVAKVSADLISIVQLAVVARYIDKADFGLMSTVHVVLGLVMMFSDLGMYAAMMHKQDISENQYSSIYWMNWAINIFLFLIICAIAYPVSLFYGEPRLTFLIILLGSNALLAPFGKIFYTIKQKNLEFGFISKVRILNSLVTLVATVIMCICGCGILSLIIPVLIASAVNAAIFSIEGRKSLRVRWHFNFAEIRDMFHIGMWDTGAQILNYICYKLDVLLVGKLFGMEVLGLYNIGKELAMKAYKMISAVLGPVIAPLLSKFQNEQQALEKNYLMIIRSVSFVSYPILIALMIFAEPTVEIFFSETYAGSAPYVSILCLWALFASVGTYAGQLIIATGRTDLEFKWEVVRLVFVPLTVVLASLFSPIAIAWSQVILQCVFFVIYWRMMIFAAAGIKFEAYIRAFVPAASCVMIASVPAFIFHHYFESNIYADLICGCAIFAITYLLAAWKFNKKMFVWGGEILNTLFVKR